MSDLASKRIAKNATVFVDRSVGRKGETPEESNEEEVLGVHEFITQPAEVEVSVGMSLNIGNYESAKIGVTLRMPCYAEEIDKTYIFAQKWAEERVAKERDLVMEWRKNGRKINPL